MMTLSVTISVPISEEKIDAEGLLIDRVWEAVSPVLDRAEKQIARAVADDETAGQGWTLAFVTEGTGKRTC
jgi:hypothetical protein